MVPTKEKPGPTPLQLVFQAAEEMGIRLEVTGGLTTWEGHPVWKHQKAIDRIRGSIKRIGGSESDCGCVHAADVSICFPDGSHKRPDIAIFCREPENEDEETMMLPEAVVEILSKGYEAKDIEISIPFYRAQGVKDVILFDPYTGNVLHYRRDGEQELTSPVRIHLECGCECTV